MTLLLFPACAAELPAEDLSLESTARELATVLAADEPRRTVQAHVAATGASELALQTLGELTLAEGTIAELLPPVTGAPVLVSPRFDAALFEAPLLVGVVEDLAATEVVYFDGDGAALRLPVGEMPPGDFVVLRPRELHAEPIAVYEPEPSYVLLNLFIREIDMSNDHEAVGDAEIYVRCNYDGGTDRTDLPSVNSDTKRYALWDKRIVSTLSSGQMTCEVMESDTGYDDKLGGFLVPVADVLTRTDHDSCFPIYIGDAWLELSKSKGYDQCTQWNYLGIHCPEACLQDM